MHTKELRIGNYLQGAKGHEEVIQILENNLVSIKGSSSKFDVGTCLSFIPLTEEWLLRFGFDDEDKPKVFNKTVYSVRRSLDNPNDWGFRIYGMEISAIIQYVHQLQNLYFALTGEELEINEPY